MKFLFMRENRTRFCLKIMARVFNITVGAYHAWRKRGKSQRRLQDQQLGTQIEKHFKASRNTYGAPRIKLDLQSAGVRASRPRITRLMKERNLRPIQKRKFKVTTNSNHDHPITNNILNRNFYAKKPDLKWVTDITYLRTTEGWVYLAVVLDLFSRRIVGWSMQTNLGTLLVLNALEMATRKRKPDTGFLHHSDRGAQYASHEYAQALARLEVVQSMSRKGNCWDNSVCESFFATLKTELQLHNVIGCQEFTKGVVFERRGPEGAVCA